MSQKASLLRLLKNSVREKLKGTKDGGPQDYTVVASPVVSATSSESAAVSTMMGIDAFQPAKSSPVPTSIELWSPKQVTSSPSPSAPSVQQPATTLSAEHPPLAPLIAPPALTISRVQTALSAPVDPTALSGPEQLWDRAYDDLKADEPKLLKLYETILSRELDDSSKEAKENVIEQRDSVKRRSQMDCLLNAGLDKTQKLAKVEKNIGDAINIVLSVKEAIGSALQAVPIAALAWAGVCVALQASLPSRFVC
jgi:hypothetical protein